MSRCRLSRIAVAVEWLASTGVKPGRVGFGRWRCEAGWVRLARGAGSVR